MPGSVTGTTCVVKQLSHAWLQTELFAWQSANWYFVEHSDRNINGVFQMLCYAMLCYAMLCYAMLCYAIRCCIHFNLRNL